jgi:hypothetical protein
VGQIETSRLPDPIMRRPCADREEKRVTRGSAHPARKQEQLDLDGPNQRGLLADSRRLHAELGYGIGPRKPRKS